MPCFMHMPCRKLAAACQAAGLFIDPALHEQNPETQKMSASAASSEWYGDADAGSRLAVEVSLLPNRIKQRYLEILLEWIIPTVYKSATAAPQAGAGAGGTAHAVLHLEVRAWWLLHTLLRNRAAASSVMLSESLLPAMILVCSDPDRSGAAASN